MQFTGRNLLLLQRAVRDALDSLHNTIGGCPDVEQYAEDIEALEADKAEFEKLLKRINHRIGSEL